MNVTRCHSTVYSAEDIINISFSMIQIGWIVSDSLLILYVKTNIAIKWWLLVNMAICYKVQYEIWC